MRKGALEKYNIKWKAIEKTRSTIEIGAQDKMGYAPLSGAL